MIKVTLTNEILKYITEIEQNRYKVSSIKLSQTVMNKPVSYTHLTLPTIA